jgi:hypothetical protein
LQPEWVGAVLDDGELVFALVEVLASGEVEEGSG